MKTRTLVVAAITVVVAMAGSFSVLGVASADKPTPSVDPTKVKQEQQWDDAHPGGAAVAPQPAPMGITDYDYNLHKDKYIDFNGSQVRMYLDSNWVGYWGMPPFEFEQAKMKDGSAKVAWLGQSPSTATT